MARLALAQEISMNEERSWWPTYVTCTPEHPLQAPTFSQTIASFLRSEVIGQDHVIRSLVRTLTISRLRAQVMTRPLGLFLFLGPTGVGKSQMTRRLAELFYGDRSRILNVACTADLCAESFVGSVLPAVGFRQASDGMVGDVEQVIVLENVEKATPGFLSLVNHLVDVGQLPVQFNQTLLFGRSCLVLESRQCSERVERVLHSGVGFRPQPSEATAVELEERIASTAESSAAELLGLDLFQRLDGVLVFKPLRHDVLPALLDKLVLDVSRQLGRCGMDDISIALEDTARAHLLALAASCTQEGGWALRKLVREHVTYPVVDMVLSGRLQSLAAVSVDETGGQLTFTLTAGSTETAIG
ncbi:MAG: AAA family ATPase [Planctomycetota bacterium]